MGKARLAPLKQITISRMELSAAVVATRLNKIIRREIDVPIDESIFWTDSTCVLGYIRNEVKRFQTFVANRVAAIHDETAPSQWKHVDTQSIPADDASRGLATEYLIGNKRWLRGPEFLRKAEEAWPEQPTMISGIPADDPEINKEAQIFATKTCVGVEVINHILESFSSWDRLKKFVAWIRRYSEKLREACKKRGATTVKSQPPSEIKPITVGEMMEAEKSVLRFIHRQHFQEEVHGLGKDQVKKSSVIGMLDPKLVDGLLCVGGRLRHAPIRDEAKHPAILPRNHPVSRLIVRHYHFISAHSGIEHVLSLIRERLWIVGGRALVKKGLSECFDCRRRQAPVGEQKMADLSQNRVTPDRPPFTFVGVDCFDPFLVRRGSSTVKRYGILFTCLTVRAIHIEPQLHQISSLHGKLYVYSITRHINQTKNVGDQRNVFHINNALNILFLHTPCTSRTNGSTPELRKSTEPRTKVSNLVTPEILLHVCVTNAFRSSNLDRFRQKSAKTHSSSASPFNCSLDFPAQSLLGYCFRIPSLLARILRGFCLNFLTCISSFRSRISHSSSFFTKSILLSHIKTRISSILSSMENKICSRLIFSSLPSLLS